MFLVYLSICDILLLYVPCLSVYLWYSFDLCSLYRISLYLWDSLVLCSLYICLFVIFFCSMFLVYLSICDILLFYVSCISVYLWYSFVLCFLYSCLFVIFFCSMFLVYLSICDILLFYVPWISFYLWYSFVLCSLCICLLVHTTLLSCDPCVHVHLSSQFYCPVTLMCQSTVLVYSAQLSWVYVYLSTKLHFCAKCMYVYL
jgi:hypothetical protein